MAFINISTNQIDSYILVVCQKTRPVGNFYIVVLSKKKKKKVQIIKRIYLMTNIDIQETDYSVYCMTCIDLFCFQCQVLA